MAAKKRAEARKAAPKRVLARRSEPVLAPRRLPQLPSERDSSAPDSGADIAAQFAAIQSTPRLRIAFDLDSLTSALVDDAAARWGVDRAKVLAELQRAAVSAAQNFNVGQGLGSDSFEEFRSRWKPGSSEHEESLAYRIAIDALAWEEAARAHPAGSEAQRRAVAVSHVLGALRDYAGNADGLHAIAKSIADVHDALSKKAPKRRTQSLLEHRSVAIERIRERVDHWLRQPDRWLAPWERIGSFDLTDRAHLRALATHVAHFVLTDNSTFSAHLTRLASCEMATAIELIARAYQTAPPADAEAAIKTAAEALGMPKSETRNLFGYVDQRTRRAGRARS